MGTLKKSTQKSFPIFNYSLEDFLAQISQSLENIKDLKENKATYFLKYAELLGLKDLHIYSLKMSEDCLLTTGAKHSKQSCGRWMNWGMKLNTHYITARISENRSQDREYILKGLFGRKSKELMLAKGVTKKHRYCLTSRRGLEIRTTTGKKLAECPPRLYEQMQGFPFDWTEGVPKTVRKFLLGNAITPDIPKEIFKNLK